MALVLLSLEALTAWTGSCGSSSFSSPWRGLDRVIENPQDDDVLLCQEKAQTKT